MQQRRYITEWFQTMLNSYGKNIILVDYFNKYSPIDIDVSFFLFTYIYKNNKFLIGSVKQEIFTNRDRLLP